MKNLVQKYGKDFYNNDDYRSEYRKNAFEYRQIRDEFNKNVKNEWDNAPSRSDYLLKYDN